MPSSKKKDKSKLEAERKAAEEEEQRRLLIQQQKEEEFRKEQEEKIKQEHSRNLARFQEDCEGRHELKKNRHNRYCYEQKLIDEESEWIAFMKCEDVISYHDKKTLNSWMSEAKSDAGIFQQNHLDKIYHQAGHIAKELRCGAMLEYNKTQCDYEKGLEMVKSLIDEVIDCTTKRVLHGGCAPEYWEGSHVAFSYNSTIALTGFILNQHLGAIHRDLGEEGDCCMRLVKYPFLNSGMRSMNSIIGDVFRFDLLKRFEASDRTLGVARCTNTIDYECEMTIPKDSTICKSLQLMMFNGSDWTKEGISNFKQENGRAFFHLHQNSAIVGLFQQKNLYLPYRSWRLSPFVKEGHDCGVQLRLRTAQHEVLIQVEGSVCRILEPRLSDFEKLIDEDFSPARLLLELNQRGLQLLPTNNFQNMDLNEKTKMMEMNFYQEISLLSSSFDVESCALNALVAKDQAICKIKASSAFTGADDPLPMDLLLTQVERKSSLIAIGGENSETLPSGSELVTWSFIKDITEDEFELSSLLSGQIKKDDSHLYPLFCTKGKYSKDAYARVIDSSPVTIHTLHQLLSLVRPLIFCK